MALVAREELAKAKSQARREVTAKVRAFVTANPGNTVFDVLQRLFSLLDEIAKEKP